MEWSTPFRRIRASQPGILALAAPRAANPRFTNIGNIAPICAARAGIAAP